MDVSIIIVNYNTLRMTDECITSIVEKTEGLSYEIILVDNASTDGSKEFFSKDNRVTYIYNNENIGFGRANNIGFQKACGRNILLLNTDTLLINNAIKVMSDFLDSNEKAGACGGNLFSSDNYPLHSFRRAAPLFFELNTLTGGIPAKIRFGKNTEHNYSKRELRVNTIVGADLMIKKHVLEKTGYFDDRFFMYCEEMELCHRIRKAGYVLYAIPNAKIIHLEGASFSSDRFIERIKMNRIGLKLYCSIHYNMLYYKAVNFIWMTTIHSRCIIYGVISSPKKSFWNKLRKTFS